MTTRFSRQSFLGPHSQQAIESATVGIIGLGGGGSHIAQQLAHVGFLNFVLIDPDSMEESNLNRLIGAYESDIAAETPKVDIAKRLIKGIREDATIEKLAEKWQTIPDALKKCDLIFGCMDGFKQRREIEATTRRYLIPYIDIGMDVFVPADPEPPRVAGQVILSLPDGPCTQCVGFPTEAALTREASNYGDAGDHPQVVWINGVLASTAVGIAVDLLTGWTKSPKSCVYFSYDGNSMHMKEHPRLSYRSPGDCEHHPLEAVGEPKFTQI